jgi:hypothetical protein
VFFLQWCQYQTEDYFVVWLIDVVLPFDPCEKGKLQRQVNSSAFHSRFASVAFWRTNRNPMSWLGMFTQDLAPELDVNSRALDIVSYYAREGSDGDYITVSEQDARGAMGRIGLQGEKALRRIADLSGGEKARVALAMFSLKASIVYFRDKPSNDHLILNASFIKELNQKLQPFRIHREPTMVRLRTTSKALFKMQPQGVIVESNVSSEQTWCRMQVSMNFHSVQPVKRSVHDILSFM